MSAERRTLLAADLYSQTAIHLADINDMRYRIASTFSTALLIAIASAPATAQSTLPAYAPGTARYRLVTAVTASQVMMGQTQTSETRTDEVHTVVISKTGNGLTQVMTVDTASFTSNPPIPTPDVATLLGLKFTATMGMDGKVTTSAVTDKSGAPSTDALATGLRSFLPRLKPGATVGATWNDSSSYTRKQNGADVTNTIASTFTLLGDTTVAGAHAWKVGVASTGKLSGSGVQQGADFTISGTMAGRGTIVIATTGVLLGADLTTDVSMTADVPMAGLSIPITQKQTSTITKLP